MQEEINVTQVQRSYSIWKWKEEIQSKKDYMILPAVF